MIYLKNVSLSFLIIFFGFVFSCVSFTSIARADSSSIFLTSTAVKITEGQNVVVSVKVRSEEQAMNAVSGVLNFPSDLLQIVSISKANTLISIWTEDLKQFGERILFEGVILNPGYQGPSGSVFSVTFKARNAGIAVLDFSEGSILANDGKGTNIIGSLNGVNINITATPKTPVKENPPIKEPSKPPVIIDTPIEEVIDVVPPIETEVEPEPVYEYEDKDRFFFSENFYYVLFKFLFYFNFFALFVLIASLAYFVFFFAYNIILLLLHYLIFLFRKRGDKKESSAEIAETKD